jgi:hypothetical protein
VQAPARIAGASMIKCAGMNLRTNFDERRWAFREMWPDFMSPPARAPTAHERPDRRVLSWPR